MLIWVLEALMEILVEELGNHLYLKTAYSESRWVVYQPGQSESKSSPCRCYNR